jgi:outer membrane immunogenic protein
VVVIPKAYDWGGHYFGIQGGWDGNQAQTGIYKSDENGGIVGLFGGWNIQHAGNWVFGLDASLNWDFARAHASSPPSTTFDAGPHWKGFVRGRLGFALDRILIYGTGGAAVMRYEASSSAPVTSASATPWGWTAGLGVDWAVSSNLFARLDWAYQNYGTFTIHGSGAFNNQAVSLTANTFTVGLAMKF